MSQNEFHKMAVARRGWPRRRGRNDLFAFLDDYPEVTTDRETWKSGKRPLPNSGILSRSNLNNGSFRVLNRRLHNQDLSVNRLYLN